MFLFRSVFCTALFAGQLFSTCFGQNITPEKVSYVFHFATNDATVSNQYKEAYSAIVKNIKGDVISIFITGHTDDMGSDNSNIELSKARCYNVYDLVKNSFSSLDTNKIKLNWYGETMPLNDNASEVDKAANRRVELIIETLPVVNDISVEDFYKSIATTPQLFCIDNTKDTAIVARQGTIIYIKAHTIELADKCASSCITVEVKEALDKADIVRENLTTVSGDKILVSQSMVYVGFKCGNQSLSLLPDKNYVIMAPTNEPEKGSQVFYGVPAPLPGHFEWTRDENGKGDGLFSEMSPQDVKDCNEQRNAWRGRDVIEQKKEDCSNCPLFFCGGVKWIKGLFNASKRKIAKDNFNCRKEYREKQRIAKEAAKQPPPPPLPPVKINARDSLNKLYANRALGYSRSDSCERLATACDRIQCLAALLAIKDSLLTQKLLKASEKNTKENNPIKYTDIDQLKYNVYSPSQTGWTNIDWMMKYEQKDLQPITVMLAPNDYTDCKIIFKQNRTVLPALRDANDRFVFPLIPKGMDAWVLIVNTKTGEGKVDIQLKNIKTGEQTIEPDFKRVDGKTFISMLNTLDK